MRSTDATCVHQGNTTLRRDDPELNPLELTSEMQSVILKATGAETLSAPPLYVVPPRKAFFPYLMALEGLMTLKLASEFKTSEFLYSPRDIVDRVLTLSVDCPSNAAVRMLLVQTVTAMKKV